MESKRQKNIYNILIIIFIILSLATIALSIYYMAGFGKQASSRSVDSDTRNYHIIITGSYENQLFLQKVYEGANLYSDQYKAVVELYVPGTQAEDVPLQSLLDYVSFVNADGVIAFNDTLDGTLNVPRRTNDDIIPLVTTGLYNPNVPQISFIGTSYWELGKKICNEIILYLHGKGNVVIVSSDYLSNVNSANLLNSLLEKLRTSQSINYTIVEEAQLDDFFNNTNLIACLSEEDTIKTAQKIQEINFLDSPRPGVLGFGTNETCQLYLEKGAVNELIDVDPKKIGETAIRELFEFRNKGYANSYIAADVQIMRSGD